MSDLSRWCLAHYEALHDFAAPVATVTAAGVAVFVTWRLGRRQVKIAEQQAETARQQADIALDKLRHDLFEKRYAIYQTTKRMIDNVWEAFSENRSAPIFLHPSLIVIDEARFFYPKAICDFLYKIGNECEAASQLFAKRAVPRDHATELAIDDQINKVVDRVLAYGREMPARFEVVLGFPRLTREQPGRTA